MSNARKSILLVLVILLADQTLKILVKTNMTLYQQIPFLGQWGTLHFVENNGMAFGLALPGELGKILLTSFRLVAVVAIALYMRHLNQVKAHNGLIITLSMIMAGALGNIIDSLFYGIIFSESTPMQAAVLFPEGGGYSSLMHGKVVDMFYFPVLQGNYPSWFRGGASFVFFRPVFNLADASISVAVFVILFNQRRFFHHLTQEPEGENLTDGPEPVQTESTGTEPSEEATGNPFEEATGKSTETATGNPFEEATGNP
ncbi:MAG: lipoprotein signal peptidase [Bacteroidales bacterium]